MALFVDLIKPDEQLMLISGGGVFFFREINRTFDLFVSSESLLAVILASSFDFTLFSSLSGVAALTKRHVSSANNRGIEETEFKMLFIYNKKSNSPNVEHWGTPTY